MATPQDPTHNPGPEGSVSQPGAKPAAQAHDASTDDAQTQALADALRSSFQIVRALMILLVIVFFSSGVFTVNPNELAIKLRFGKPVGTGEERLLKPCLHWAFPYPIDEVVRIPVGQSHSIGSSIGWYAMTPDERAAGTVPAAGAGYMRAGVDGYTLTGDGNTMHVQATVTYRVRPQAADRYAFDYTAVTNTIQDLVDNALVYASARFTADALYRHDLAFTDLVRSRTVAAVDALQLGIEIETVGIEASPPLDVRQAFDQVLTAQQSAQARVSESQGYARGATNSALGESTAILNNAVTASNQLVRTVAAEARSFRDQLPQYQSNPWLFRQRLMAETMGRVLTNVEFSAFIPERREGPPRVLNIQLNRGAELPKGTAAPAIP